MAGPRLQIAICGGGIAGLTTALSLCKFSKGEQDIKIDIYEASSEHTELSFGVGVWLRPWRILCDLGLYDDLKALVDRPLEFNPQLGLGWEHRKADQAQGVSYYDAKVPIGFLGFRRIELLRVLASHLDHRGVSIHFSKCLVSYSQEGASVSLSFADGSSAVADVLIGCDGIYSRVRRQLLTEAAADLKDSLTDDDRILSKKLISSIEPVWSGMTMYRNVVTREKLAAKNPCHRALSASVYYNGKGNLIVSYPISNGKAVNVASVIYDPKRAGSIYDGRVEVNDTDNSELLQHFSGWEEELQQLLSCCGSSKVWIINQLNPLPISTRGHVALLGDAAHAMPPTQGSGAGQAIEDAYIIGALLAHPSTTRETLQAALKIYEAIRLPHANEVLKRSILSAEMGTFANPRCANIADVPHDQLDIGKLWNYGHELMDLWKWAWTTTIDDDLAKAMEMLKEQTAVVSVQA